MPPDTLTFFQNQSECGIGVETCRALSTHAESLTALKLAVSGSGLPGLALLEPCHALESLMLTDLRPPHDLKATQNDVFMEMIKWLQQCSNLHDVTLVDLISAPALLAPVLESSSIRLTHLQINANSESALYNLKDHHDFHRALSRQTDLTSLLLKADADGVFFDDNATLCDCLCQLKSLKRLSLTRVTEMFTDGHICILAAQLLQLEELLVDGYGITDASLDKMTNLGNLKSLTFSGLTSFTADGLLDFVDRLGPGNDGLALSVDRAQTDSALTDAERNIIGDALFAKVQGRFEYQLLRGKVMNLASMT